LKDGSACQLAELRSMAKFHRGEVPTMTFERELDPSHRLVIRLWPTTYQVEMPNHPPVALWVGMVALERLMHPAGFATLAITDQGFDVPTAQLKQSLQTQGVRLDIKHTDTTAVLLVQ